MAEETQSLILDIQFDSAQAVKEATDLKNKIAELRKENSELIKSEGKVTDAYVKNEVEIKVLTKELNANQASLVKQTQANNAAAGSNDKLRATLSVLTAQYNALSKEERDSSVAGQVLGKAIKNISDELKGSEGAVGDFRRNVGDYEGAANRAANSIEGMKARLQALNQVVQTSEVGSKQFKDAQNEAANLGLSIGQLEGKLDEFGNKEPKNPAKRAFEDTLSSAAAAGSAVQLTSLLFDENGKSAEALAKSVKALAIGQQIANIVKEKGAILDTANAVATGVATAATGAYGAVVSTVTALSALFGITAAAAWAAATLGVAFLIAGIVLLIANFEKVVNAITDFLGITNEQERASEALQKAYASEAEQLGLLISLTEKRIATVDGVYNRQIALLKAQGKSTDEVETKQAEYHKREIQRNIEAIQSLLNKQKLIKKSAKEEIDLKQQLQDQLNALADAENEIEVAKATKLKENQDAALKAAEEQAKINKERNEKIKADNEKAAEDEKKLINDLANARLALLEDGLNKEVLLAEKAAQDKLNAITGTGATAEALRLTIAQETEQQIAGIRAKFADENIAKQKEVAEKEAELALQRQEREAVEFEARQQAVIAQAEFEFAQQQLGLSNQDAAFLKTTQGLYDLVAVQQATGLSRQEIDQQYFDFFETQGELSFEQFIALQAQQVASTQAANEQMIASYAAFGGQVGDLLGKQLAEAGGDLKAFARQFLVLILDTVQKQVTAAVVASSVKSIAEFGPIAGGIRAAVSIAAINAAFGLAKAKLSQPAQGFATGVVGLDGAGTTTSDSIPAMLSKGESVITAEGTNYAQQNAPGLLEFLNTKNKFATGVVDFGASGNGADLGGFSLIAEAISRIQPVVQVSDINKKQSDYVEVRTTGTL